MIYDGVRDREREQQQEREEKLKAKKKRCDPFECTILLWYLCAHCTYCSASSEPNISEANKRDESEPTIQYVHTHSLALTYEFCAPVACPLVPPHTHTCTHTHSAHALCLSLVHSIAVHIWNVGLLYQLLWSWIPVRCALTLKNIYIHTLNKQISNSTNFETPNSVHALLLLYVFFYCVCTRYISAKTAIDSILFYLYTHTLTLTRAASLYSHIKFIWM